MAVELNQTVEHKCNSRLAKRGEAAAPAMLHRMRVEQVQLVEVDGRWMVAINGGSLLPATDVEVFLWLRLQEERNA